MLSFSNKQNDNYPVADNNSGDNSLKDNRFSSKANADQNGENTALNQPEDVSVHAMPGKFLPDKTAKKSSGGGKVLTFVAVFLFLGVLVAAGAYWYLNLPKVPKTEDINQPVVEQNTNQNTNQNVNANENQNVNENVNANENQNVNENTNENSNEVVTAPLLESPDTDNDLLTLEEEAVFGTNSSLDDTDKDGYKDGAEITNLYNPLVPVQALVDSGLITKFVNSVFSYSIMRPSSWLAQSIADDLGNIMVLPDSESGEFFTIYAMANTNNWNLNQAKQNLPDIFASENYMQNYSLAKQPALRSIDQKKVLMVTKDYVYVIVHESSNLTKGNLKTIFQMMLNSFELSPNE